MLQRKYQFGNFTSTNTFKNISVGSFIWAKADEPHHSVLIPQPSSQTIRFYAVLCILKCPEKNGWLICKQLQPESEEHIYSFRSTARTQCIQLNQAVTVLGKISASHDFDNFDRENFPVYGVPECASRWVVSTNKQRFSPRIS